VTARAASSPRAVHAAACAATVAFALMLELPTVVAVPLPWYQPVDHAWTFGVSAHGIAMAFYGHCLYAALAGAVAAAAVLAVARRCEPTARATTWLAGLAVAVVVGVAARETLALAARDLRSSPRLTAPPELRASPSRRTVEAP
jgi:hypothetical protein